MNGSSWTDRSKQVVAVVRDHSALSLLATNLFTMAVALIQRWDLLSLMWVYWGQSVIIGLFNFWRMWTLKRFTTRGLTSNGKPVPETVAGKRSTALFFLFHYGFFHVGYMVFLLTGPPGAEQDGSAASPVFIALCVAGFFANHLYSFRYNRERDSERTPNLGTIMFFPYARILPMHLTIIFGWALARSYPWIGLLIFLILKTVADLIMHGVEHAEFGSKKEDSL